MGFTGLRFTGLTHAFSVSVSRGDWVVETNGAATGAADDVVVLLGGLGDSSRWIEAVAARCRAGIALLSIDQMLGGRNDVHDLTVVLDAFEVREAVVVSSGDAARSALDFWRNAPERVRSLVLVGPTDAVGPAELGDGPPPGNVEVLLAGGITREWADVPCSTFVPGLDRAAPVSSPAGTDATMAAILRALRRRGAPSPAT